jgi:hypothetical protein
LIGLFGNPILATPADLRGIANRPTAKFEIRRSLPNGFLKNRLDPPRKLPLANRRNRQSPPIGLDADIASA